MWSSAKWLILYNKNSIEDIAVDNIADNLFSKYLFCAYRCQHMLRRELIISFKSKQNYAASELSDW